MSLKKLNKIQKAAVEANDGPVLIFAGAGSGKTRVLTHKMSYLIKEGHYKPENILSVTFTNKAAKEMKLRVMKLLKTDDRKDKYSMVRVWRLSGDLPEALRRPQERTQTSPYCIDLLKYMKLNKSILRSLENKSFRHQFESTII